MTATFQKTLYYPQGAQWHYTRLRWIESAQYFDVLAAPCGQTGTAVGKEWLQPGESREAALHRLALPLRQAGGLEIPTLEWHLDLTITTPEFDGFMAAAPWFDTFHAGLLYPLLWELGETANYGHCGGTRYEENGVTHFLWTADPLAAEAVVNRVRRIAPDRFEISARIRKRGEAPVPQAQTTAVSWDTEIALGLGKNIISAAEKRQYARSLPENQPIPEIIRADASYPYLPNLGPHRVMGAKAEQLRQRLYSHWEVGRDRWPPLGSPISRDLLYQEGGLEDEMAERLTALLQQKAIGTVYVFDSIEGIFSSTIEQVFPDLAQDDSYWFDESMEWILYKSHHNTITFAGEWLMKEVRNIFKEAPDQLFYLAGHS